MRRRRTSTRSSSGRRRRATAATASRSAPTTPSGSRSGLRSRVEPPGPLRCALPPPVAAGPADAQRPRGMVRGDLPARPRDSVHLGVLAGGRVHGGAHPRLEPRQLPADLREPDVPDDRAADDRNRRSRDLDRRAAGAAVRVLRGTAPPPAAPDPAPRRLQTALFVIVLVPLWTSYLVRVYAWRLILAKDGILNWTLDKLGLGSLEVADSSWAMWIVFSYIWLPFMILPVWLAFERVPDSYLEASADLGARGWTTLRKVMLPLVFPGLVAGSIFTFSLTLGDYITPTLVGGAGSDFIGNVVYRNVGIANNVPFAAAYATIPLVVMGIYLLAARRLGALEAM